MTTRFWLPLLALLPLLAACEHPAENIRSGLEKWCANQTNCDVNAPK